MCGFVGILSNKHVSKDILEKSINSISYRGPDDKKILQSDYYNFAFCRLAINDLTEKSNQPFVDNNKILVFNGEIYNFRDLNYSFNLQSHKNSDTSTLFNLLNLKGNQEALKELNGMFSFAIYDKKKKELFCARDRFGQKPFFFSIIDNETIIFSSEIKAILCSGLIKPSINIKFLYNYLQNSYDNEQTIYNEVLSLQPGHSLSFSKNKVEIKKYSVKKNDYFQEIKEMDVIDNFEKLFSNSIEKQLNASVETGVLLSGGLDSTLIVSEAAKQKRNIKTFSYGFSEGNNELSYSKQVAEKFSTDHFEFFDKDLKVADMINLMQKIYDEPFSDSSNIPTFLISKLASKHVKVTLTGDGADELLMGYSNWHNRIFKLKEIQDSTLSKIFNINFKNKIIQKFTKYSLFLKYNKIIYESVNEKSALKKLTSSFTDSDLLNFGLKTDIKYSKKNYSGELLKLFYEECINDYLPNNILYKSDRASMFNSLELRAPFLDEDLSNMLLSMEQKFKIDKNKITKKILRIILKKRGLENNIYSRNKMGFGSPINKWLKRDDVFSLKKSTLLDKNNKMYNFLDYNYAKNFFNKGNMQEWCLLILSTWFANNKYI